MGTNLPFAAGGGRFAANDVLLDGVDNNTSTEAGSIGRSGSRTCHRWTRWKSSRSRRITSARSSGIQPGQCQRHDQVRWKQLSRSWWEFLRNEQFDANNFFSNANALRAKPFKQNQFGGTFSGPVTIRSCIRGRIERSFSSTMKRPRGDLSVLLNAGPASRRLPAGQFFAYNQPIYDPAARRIGPAGTVVSTVFPNNTIPPRRSTDLRRRSSGSSGSNAGAPGGSGAKLYPYRASSL